MIYLDYNASSPLRPEAKKIMLNWMDHCGGNASSKHQAGRQAYTVLESSREALAQLLHVAPHQVVFTSGGTEANNLAVLGVLPKLDPYKKMLFSAIEHPSVARIFEQLQVRGYRTQTIPVTSSGLVNMSEFNKKLDSETSLVSIMAANNETGVVQPVQEIARICQKNHVLLHCDAAQLVGRLPVPWTSDSCPDIITCSGHKCGAAQGVGVLVDHTKGQIQSVFSGGLQEHRLRPGTENIAAIAGWGALAPVLDKEMAIQQKRQEMLRDRLEKGILLMNEDFQAFGCSENRLPNTTLISFSGHNGMTLASRLDQLGLAVGTGAACSSNSMEPSHVLGAMGVPGKQAISTIRLSLGWQTQDADISRALEIIKKQV